MAETVLAHAIDPRLQQPGILHGYERLLVAEECYPALAPRLGGKVTGVVVEGISDADMARMQFFESDEFAPHDCDIELASGEHVGALVFLARENLERTDQPWDFELWRRRDKPEYLALVRGWMQEYGKREALELEAAWRSARREQMARRSVGDSRPDEKQTRGGKS